MGNYLTQVFFNCIHIGYQAGIAVIVVIFARAFLNKIRVPKKYICFLWFIPFVRLVLPVLPQSVFSIFSIFGFLPKQAETVQDLLSSASRMPVIFSATKQPEVSTGSEFMSQVVWQSLPSAASETGISSLQFWMSALTIVWVVGIASLFLYGFASVVSMKKKLRASVCEYDNIYLADGIFTAFVLGLHRARIYLPSDFSEDVREYVICHEKQHIRRKDHIMKIIFFILTCIYWFHPLIWAAYILVNKDIEFACDEAVIESQSPHYREKYAEALLALSIKTKDLVPVSPAFSEGNPKKRIEYIVAYKKPIFMIGIIGLCAVALLAVGLLTKPVEEPAVGQAETLTEIEESENIKADKGEADGIEDTDGDTETEEITITDMDADMYVTGPVVRFRESYDFESETLGLLAQGDKVKVTGITSDKQWYRAQMEEEGTVFIYADYLSAE